MHIQLLKGPKNVQHLSFKDTNFLATYFVMSVSSALSIQKQIHCVNM